MLVEIIGANKYAKGGTFTKKHIFKYDEKENLFGMTPMNMQYC